MCVEKQNSALNRVKDWSSIWFLGSRKGKIIFFFPFFFPFSPPTSPTTINAEGKGRLNCITTGNMYTDWQGNYWCRQWCGMGGLTGQCCTSLSFKLALETVEFKEEVLFWVEKSRVFFLTFLNKVMSLLDFFFFNLCFWLSMKNASHEREYLIAFLLESYL